MELLQILILALGLGAALMGIWIGYLITYPKLKNLSTDLDIKSESYNALKGQYETNIKKYESLHHSLVKLEEKYAKLKAEHEIVKTKREVDQAQIKSLKILLTQLRTDVHSRKSNGKRKDNLKKRKSSPLQEEYTKHSVVQEEVIVKDTNTATTKN